ncbi:MAG: S-layer homology domain-containing protein, partial [Halanaerobiales bacterium]
MKKSLVIAILLLALTVSAFAGSFADVPANHWAYEAVNKLVAAGLITGYPDGTFKGQNTLTRYEVATILARLLENLAEARAELMDQVTFMLHDTVLSVESGLSVAQAEDVQAILQAVIEKNAGGAPVDALTAEDAAELYGTMLDLAIEFDKELMDLGIRVSKLEKRVADLEEATSEKPAVSFYGEYKAEFKDYSYSDGTPKGAQHENPFNYKDDPKYGAGSELKHSLDVNVKVENGPLAADMDLSASIRDFKNNSKTESIKLEGLSATITGNDFKATIKDDQVAGIRDYLFKGDDDHKVNGAVVETANGKYLLHGDTDDASKKYAAAGSNSLDLLGGLNVVYGFEKKYEDVIDLNDTTTTALFGVNKTFNLCDFDVTPEFAMNLGGAKGKYFTLNAAGDLGAIATTFNYKNIEADFTPIRGKADKTKGFD